MEKKGSAKEGPLGFVGRAKHVRLELREAMIKVACFVDDPERSIQDQVSVSDDIILRV